MKKLITITSIALAAMVLLDGCVVALGSGDKHSTVKPTVGQQLVDLKKAKDSGAINDAEYEAQRAKVMQEASK